MLPSRSSLSQQVSFAVTTSCCPHSDSMLMIVYIQLWQIYRTKTTAGYSMLGVWIDLAGGVFSLLQMFILAYNYGTLSPHMQTDRHTHTLTCTRTHTHTHTYVCTNSHNIINTCTQIHKHKCMHTYTTHM